MLLTGLVVMLFVIYHLLHFTAGVTDHSADWRRPIGGPGRPHLLDVHSMVVNGFQNPYIASFYIVCQIVLGMHLWHGGSSLFQSLGINRGFWKRITAWAGPVVAVIVVVGNCSIPIAIQARFIQCQADIEMKKAEIDFRNGKLPRLWSPANGGSASASQPH
jgi:succinate dehydrogenase / fumarate reductase cytochrome b subunit